MRSDSAFRQTVSELLKPTPRLNAAKATSAEARVVHIDPSKCLATIAFSGFESALGQKVAAGITNSVGRNLSFLSVRQGSRSIKATAVQAWAGNPLPDDQVVVTMRLNSASELDIVARGVARVDLDENGAAAAE